MSADAFLAAWQALVSDLSALADEALDVEPLGGSSVAWAKRLTRLRVTPMPEAERQPACRAAKQTKGAPMPEIHAVLAAFERAHRGTLTPMLTAEQRPIALDGLTTLVQHAKEQLEVRATAPVKKGLFRHAKETAAKHQYGTNSGPHTEVLECPSCRGPRQTEVLVCVFCGSDLM